MKRNKKRIEISKVIKDLRKLIEDKGPSRRFKSKKRGVEVRERTGRSSKKKDWLAEYYTPEWYERRKEILKRDQYRCQQCRSTTALQVHHKIYDSKLHVWEYEDQYLVTLCHSCHEELHKDRPGKKLINKGKPLRKYVKKEEGEGFYSN